MIFFFFRNRCLVDMLTPFAMNFSSSSPPYTHSQYLYKLLCMHMYVHPQRQLDTHPHEHTLTYTNVGSTSKIVSELIIFILYSRSHFWIGVLMQYIFFPFFFNKKTHFSPNWTDLGLFWPVLDRIRNQEKKTRDGRVCSRIDGCTLCPCELDVSVPPLEAHSCFPGID